MCSDVMRALRGMGMLACQPSQLNVARQKLLMDVQFMQADLYILKVTASHFNTLNTRIANKNVLERILVSVFGENMAKSNENFRVGAEEPVAPLYKW